VSAEQARSELRDLARATRSERVSRLFDFEAFDYQANILDDPNPDVVVTCGRQVGKTETGGAIGADAFVTSDGYDVMIAAKWQETADELLRRAKKHLTNAGFGEKHPEIATWNKTEIESITGARLYSKTLKVADGEAGDNQRGKLPRVVIIDESALIEADVIGQVIRPMFLTHGDDHELYLLSTPRGKQGFHYEKHKNDDSWSAHHVPSSASPLIDDDYLEAERSNVDDITWRQEYLGEFIDLGEVYIGRESYDRCTASEPPPLGETRFLGVDIARQGKDRTVYVGMDEAGHVRVFDAESKSDVRGVVERIGTLHQQHDFAAAGADDNAVGGGVVDYAIYDLGDIMHPIAFTTKNKSLMYRKLKGDLESGDLVLPPKDASEHAERLRDETVNLQYDYTANGHLKVHHAPGAHDDYADALAMVNWIRDNAATQPVTVSATW
jgi:hypothetical protein